MIWATLLENSVFAGALAVVVAIVCHFQRARPAFCHLLWLLVLAVLVMPPTPLTANLGGGLRGWLSPTPDSSLPANTAPAWGGSSSAPSWGGGELDAVLVESDLPGSLPKDSVPAPTRAPSLGAVALALWATGSVIALLYMQRRIRRFHRGVRAAEPASAELVSDVAAVARRLGMRAPEVRLLEGVGSPSVWCFGPARLLWPTRGLAYTRADLTPSLIAHELAHIARRDTWVARLEVLVLAALWWHPLFWWIRREVHRYAELSCDAWALWAYPQDRLAFAEALIDAHQETLRAPVAQQGLCATNSDFHDFERRLHMILSDKVSRGVSKAAAALAIAGTLLLLPSASQEPARGEDTLEERESGSADQELEQTLAKAETVFKAGDLPRALDILEAALRLDPDNAAAHARIAYIQIGLGMPDEARVHLNHAVEYGPNVPVAAYNLACCDALSGDVAAGIQHLVKATQFGFADDELMASDRDLVNLRAAPAFGSALKLCAISAQLRAELAANTGGTERRHELLSSLYRVAPSDGVVVSDYAMSAHGQGDFEASAGAFGRQARLGYRAPTALYNLGCAWARLGKLEQAFGALDKAASMGMSYPPAADDEDLKSLHADARWADLVQRLSVKDTVEEDVARAIVDGDLGAANGLLEWVQENPERNGLRLKQANALLNEQRLSNAETKKVDSANLRAALELSAQNEKRVVELLAAQAERADQMAAKERFLVKAKEAPLELEVRQVELQKLELELEVKRLELQRLEQELDVRRANLDAAQKASGDKLQ